jgi:hypothetical protein
MEPVGATETFPTGTTTGGWKTASVVAFGGVAELQHHLNMVVLCCIMYVVFCCIRLYYAVLCCITFCRFFLYDG